MSARGVCAGEGRRQVAIMKFAHHSVHLACDGKAGAVWGTRPGEGLEIAPGSWARGGILRRGRVSANKPHWESTLTS